jgi:hypothetical protein
MVVIETKVENSRWQAVDPPQASSNFHQVRQIPEMDICRARQNVSYNCLIYLSLTTFN